MKRSYLLAFALLAFAAAPVMAEPVKVPTGEDFTVLTGPNCDLTNYKVESQVLTPAFAIVDDPTDRLVGTLAIPNDGGLFTDVIATVNINHTWVGDLILTLQYFSNCSDAAPAASASLICRPRGTGATTPAPCGTGTGAGASGDLGTATAPFPYAFSDDAVAEISDGTNVTPVPAGCYKPSVGLMSVFDGLAKGGCFKLLVSDNAAGDVGTIPSWSIASTNEGPVATSHGTWGGLKSIYR